MIFYLGEKVPRVSEQVRVARNKVKTWKYGYDEKYDVIIISKDGTLGDIFRINGINIGLPAQPPKERMINGDLQKRNQKWIREDLPKGLNESTQFSKKEYTQYIDREFERREKGAWIMINGKPVYLARTYYFFIQWIREGNKYPNFRIIQNELMLYWEACKADNRCFGVCFVKPRRFGWSLLGYTELLEAGTSHENKTLGMISKKGGDAKKIFARMVRSFKRFPFFFMPETDGTNTPKTELVFSEPNRKRRIGEAIEDGKGLDTTISWHNTEINAMDGDEIFRSLIDECGKMGKEVPFSEYWSIVQTSHTIGSEIVGKAMVGSTVNALKKGGAEFKSVYDDSNPADRQETGETKSGLYRLFIPSRFCLAGFFDEYGFSVTDDPKVPILNDLNKLLKVGSVTYLKHKLAALKHKPEKYNERLRQFPDTDRDAFRDEAGDCNFNLIKLLEQIDHNDNELNDRFDGVDAYYGNDKVDVGDLEWVGGVQDTDVIFRPNPEGMFAIKKGCHPIKEFKNRREHKFKNGVLAYAPLATHIGAFGADPYNRSKTADGRGSMGAIHGSTRIKFTPEHDMPDEDFFLEYIGRPKTVTMYFEDVIKACVYYSMPVLGELSNEAFLTYIKDRGYRHFSMNNPFKKYADLSHTEKLIGGAPPQDAKIADQQMYAIEAHIEDHVGVATDNSKRKIGEMGDMVFTRTLIQWKDVDLTSRGKYDAYISSSLSRLACQTRIKVKEEVQEEKFDYFLRYDNSGVNSKELTA